MGGADAEVVHAGGAVEADLSIGVDVGRGRFCVEEHRKSCRLREDLESNRIAKTDDYGQVRGAEQYNIDHVNGHNDGTLVTNLRDNELGLGTEANRQDPMTPIALTIE